ncbi:MAG: Fic family protein [Mycoplasma sp.]|nr:Fic family protein [Mycoplasma sp.]
MENKIKIKLSSETIINVSEKQIGILIDKFQKISYLNGKLEASNLNITANALTLSLLERESVDSSIIEGTQTNHEEMYFNIVDGIHDKYSWEVRNLINLYKSSFRDIENETIDYNIDHLKQLHVRLFNRDIDNFDNYYDPIEIIKQTKPGIIITDDNKPNWIGPKGESIKKATLILIEPSRKEEYLKDLFNEVRHNKGKRNINLLIKFHPIFEAIHPFSDGNGRLGRVLLVNLFKYLGFTKYNWIFVSDYWLKNRDEYIREMKKVQLTNKWNDWTQFFVKSIMETVDSTYNKLDSIIDLYKSLLFKNKLNEVDEKILKLFFKYPILNKNTTIKWLKTKYEIPQTNAYRSFDKVSKIIGAEKNKLFYFVDMINILKKQH